QLGVQRSLGLDRHREPVDLLDPVLARMHGQAQLGGHRQEQRQQDQPTASRMLSNSRRPSSPPRTPSAKRSGCGIIPSTLPRALVMPAMSAREPLGLLPETPRVPSGPT